MTDEPREEEPTAAAPAAETRLRRGLRYGHNTRLYLSVLALIAVGVYLILLIVGNTRHVKVDYVFGNADARVVWLIVLSAIAGWVLGLITSFLLRRRTRRHPG
jgi:uncharacterized integral membrane protein